MNEIRIRIGWSGPSWPGLVATIAKHFGLQDRCPVRSCGLLIDGTHTGGSPLKACGNDAIFYAYAR
jgi:hypothetical protein